MLEFFTDPVLRGPTIASMLMCGVAALAGVIAYLRKESLVGEALSHSTYPGVVLGAVFLGTAGILPGAFITSLISLVLIHFLETRLKVPSDAALCFTLSAFFGIGVLFASHVQFTHTTIYPQIQVYLYGQAATMTDTHILVYAVLSALFLLAIFFLYKELQVITLDRNYAKLLGIRVRLIDTLLFLLIVLSIVIGIRSVGVVLMSAMLIAPAAAARQFTDRLWIMFLIAALIGIASGFLGNFFSVFFNRCMGDWCPDIRVSLPTGPMIVLVASLICVLSIFFAPERGLILRLLRIARFRSRCMSENVLKAVWHGRRIRDQVECSTLRLIWILTKLDWNGWIRRTGWTSCELTKAGELRGARIVRLHRLWEVYLADYLEVGAEKVHCDAEEMEHIITPELERELTLLLDNPKLDPHHQPIPPKEGL